jgi:Ser/Thr protein kinase RdoA (MazF antagonist)
MEPPVGLTHLLEPAAADAACRVGAGFGYATDDALVLQETNNTIVWLRPHSVIAKVGKWRHSEESLVREHAVGTALAVRGAPIAPPVPGVGPKRDEETGFTVTLWTRLDNDPNGVVAALEVGRSLRELHQALMLYEGDLPSFETSLDLARAALWNDQAMAALPRSDRSLLRRALDRLREDVQRYDYLERPLHGEAHEGNVLITRAGLRWIDFEGVCMGPLEWDLAFLPEDALEVFPEPDEHLLGLLRTLNSARVATWCFARWEFEEMRSHGEYHLEQVRRAESERPRPL